MFLKNITSQRTGSAQEFKIKSCTVCRDWCRMWFSLDQPSAASSPPFVPANHTWSVIYQKRQGGWRTARTESAVMLGNPALLERHTCPADLGQSPAELPHFNQIYTQKRHVGEKADHFPLGLHVFVIWLLERLVLGGLLVGYTSSNLWHGLFGKQLNRE